MSIFVSLKGHVFVDCDWRGHGEKFRWFAGENSPFLSYKPLKPLTISFALTDDEHERAAAMLADAMNAAAEKAEANGKAEAQRLRERANELLRPFFDDATPAEPNEVDAAGTYRSDGLM